MKDKLEIRKIGNINVYFRKNNTPLSGKSQPEELELVVKYLTGEDFEDYGGKYKRKIINPEKFEIIEEYKDDNIDNYTCCCSEDTCNHLLIVQYIPKDLFFAVGSVCYLRFNESNSTELYYKLTAKRCCDCYTPLVFKNGKFNKNTDKKCNNVCFNCISIKEEEERNQMERLEELMRLTAIQEEQAKRIYLFVKYEDKDDAKLLGARWDCENKRWYSPDKEQKILLKKYKAYPLKVQK